jgi:nucleoside-diphosphate-sugar epimerase
MSSVLVTGGTGFFGHNLVAELIRDDRVARIHVYARNEPPTEHVLSAYLDNGWQSSAKMTAEPCEKEDRVLQSHYPNAIFSHAKVSFHKGNITDKVALKAAMEGCDVVFHACGDTRWWNAIENEQHETNVTGTINALELALATPSVRRFVYTSTVDVMGTGHGQLLYESQQGIPFDYHYAVSKEKADSYVCNRAFKGIPHGFRITVIRPGSMIGPWDVTDQYGRLFGELKWGSLLGVPCGGTSVCHVQDVARAHITAAFAPSLEYTVYVCAGMNLTYHRLFRVMRSYLKDYAGGTISKTSRIGPCCVPCEVMPENVLVFYGWLCELYSNMVSGKEPEVNPGMARYLSQHAYFISHRAEKDLDYPEQSSQRWLDAIKDSYDWYRVRGRI